MSTRRRLLAATALIALSPQVFARSVRGTMPWTAGEAYPPTPVVPDGWVYFTPDEGAALEAIVDRLIPADDLGPGGKAAGCAKFIDRQMLSPYGTHEWLYMQGPFPSNPLPSQGLQSPLVPRDEYRQGLAALDTYCKANFSGQSFARLSVAQQDQVLTQLDKGEIQLPNANGKSFFELVLTNAMEGYFADPIYGGNRDMCGWKLVGFPGARYDYRDMLDKPNQPYTLPPVSLQGRPEWNTRSVR